MKSTYRTTQRLKGLNPRRLLIIETLVTALHLRQLYRSAPWPARLAILHGLTTFATLLALPPAPTLPPVAIPLAWATSLCFAIILFAFLPVIRI